MSMTTSSIRPPFRSCSSISPASPRSGPASPGRRWRSAWRLYWLRIFAIGAGYHRYFSHRAYSTSRAFQFILAVRAEHRSEERLVVGLQAPAPSSAFRYRAGRPLAAAQRIFLQPCRLDLRATARCHRSGEGRRFRALSGADVAAPIRACAGHRARRALLSRWPAGLDWWSVSSGARCSFITRLSASTRWRMCADANAT